MIQTQQILNGEITLKKIKKLIDEGILKESIQLNKRDSDYQVINYNLDLIIF